MTVEHPMHLQGIHEEADTLIAFHVNHVNVHILVRVSVLSRLYLFGKALSSICSF